MTYNVFGGTLNLALSIYQQLKFTLLKIAGLTTSTVGEKKMPFDAVRYLICELKHADILMKSYSGT